VSGLAWGVFAPTNHIGLDDLSGNYGGATPLSIEGQVGLNVYAGVAGLELRFGQ
jgi:hypothetical protein